MDYDNERDRYTNGFDAGQIISGKVVLDEQTGHYVVVDDEGIGFDPQVALKSLEGQEIRLTITTMKAMIEMEQMLKMAEQAQKGPQN